jgi:hypothetical protein
MPKKPGYSPVMRFRSYEKSPANNGWNLYLRLGMNDKTLGADTGSGAFRVLGRGRVVETTLGRLPLYAGNLLWTFFTPGDTDVDPRAKSYRDEENWYLLDISDVVSYLTLGFDNRIESNTPNSLTITNTFRLGIGADELSREFV